MRLEELAELRLAYHDQVRLLLPYESGEGSAWGFGNGSIAGRVSGRVSWVNHPHRRSDGTFLPDAHGVIETDDSATILFSIEGRTPTQGDHAGQQLLRVFFEAADDEYRWLNDVLAVAEGVIELAGEPPTMRALVFECVHELT